ncbi:endonuclease domain-containing protein [Sphingoaurantiacus capsulatus]|uniref:Endonuclease domain-containing protein n=1 Tax=Sphingoaurantiacus capsulatus TaxID=1771310 RepID=A0ABV7X8H0_9SPHN
MSRVARETHPEAARLRREATDAERRFWRAVRNRQLAGLKFRRQVSLGPYVADFACVEGGLIVELDGSQHADAVEYDERRTRYLEAQGYRVIRFSNIDALTNLEGVLEMVLAAAGQR